MKKLKFLLLISLFLFLVYSSHGQGSATANLSITVNPAAGGGGGPFAVGWTSLTGTNYAPLCPNAGGLRPDVQGQSGCGAVVDAWAGGAADVINNYLFFTGGGHHDYYGNEIYRLDVNARTLSVLNKASDASTLNTNTNTYDAMPDGSPGARHTYNGLTFYIDANSLYFVGGGPPNPGGLVKTTWSITPSCLSPSITMSSSCYANKNPTNGNSLNAQFGNILDYDQNTQNLYLWEAWQSNPGHLWSYNLGTNTYTLLATYGSSPFMDGTQGGAIDPIGKVFYAIGNGKLLHTSIVSGFTVSDSFGRPGCNTAQTNAAYPGVYNDPGDGGMVVWNGGNTITVYHPGSDSCTQETYANGPTTVGSNGTFGRMRFFPKLGAAAVCNEFNENCFALARTVDFPANGFGSRIAGTNVPGGSGSIVSSQNFDTFPVTNKQEYFQLFKPAQITTDCTQPNTDGCALKIQMNAGDFQGEPGWFSYNFNSGLTALYGQNSEFFVQYKMRITPSMLVRSTWGATFTDWKMAILSEGDNNTTQAGNCSNTPTDFVLDSDEIRFPWVYENCGNAGSSLNFLNSPFQPVQYPNVGGGSDLLDQPASGCPHYGIGGGTGSTIPITDPTCWNYVANEWFTIQAHLKIGTWGTASSVVEQWACHQGKPCVLTTNASDAAMDDTPAGSVTDKFGKITLLPYATGATWCPNLTAGTPCATVWYDDLIVSNRRLPDPDTLSPNGPDSLSLSGISTSSITVNWRVNSNNGTIEDDNGMLVERCTGTIATCFPNNQSGFTQIATTSAHATSFTDTTVSTGHTYTYRVRAKNAYGNSSYTVAICFNGPTTCGGTAAI